MGVKKTILCARDRGGGGRGGRGGGPPIKKNGGSNLLNFISSPPPFPFPSYLHLLDAKTTCPFVLGWGGGGGYSTVDHGSCAEYALLFCNLTDNSSPYVFYEEEEEEVRRKRMSGEEEE